MDAAQFEAEWKCMVCFEIPFTNAFQAPCGHVYCRPCVTKLKPRDSEGAADGVRQCAVCTGARGFIHAVIHQPHVCATMGQIARNEWRTVWAMYDRIKLMSSGSECDLFNAIAVRVGAWHM